MDSFANARNYISIYFTSSGFYVKNFLKTECTIVSNFPPEIFINYKGKGSNFRVETLTDNTLIE